MSAKFERVRTDCAGQSHVYEAPRPWASCHTYTMLHRTFECLICRRLQVIVEVGPHEVIGKDLFDWLLGGYRTARRPH